VLCQGSFEEQTAPPDAGPHVGVLRKFQNWHHPKNHEHDDEINETWDNYFSGMALGSSRYFSGTAFAPQITADGPPILQRGFSIDPSLAEPTVQQLWLTSARNRKDYGATTVYISEPDLWIEDWSGASVVCVQDAGCEVHVERSAKTYYRYTFYHIINKTSSAFRKLGRNPTFPLLYVFHLWSLGRLAELLQLTLIPLQ